MISDKADDVEIQNKPSAVVKAVTRPITYTVQQHSHRVCADDAGRFPLKLVGESVTRCW